MSAESELREALAALEHDRWSRWQKHLHDIVRANGRMMIPDSCWEHWERQIATPYDELSEREKDSDRKEADKTMEVLRRFSAPDLRDAASSVTECRGGAK